jgi:hypothetical protein
MVEAEAELAREVAEWLSRAQVEDAAEDAAHGSTRRGDEPPDWMRDKQARLARIRAAKAELEAEAQQAQAARPAPPCDPHGNPKPRSGRVPKHPPGQPKPKAQRNFTDPESRVMKGRDGFIQAYNAHAAVDADAQIIVAHRLTNNGSDQDALLPLLDAVAETTGAMPDEVSADNGFCSEANLEGLIDARSAATWRQGALASPTTETQAARWCRRCAPGSAKADIEVGTGYENTPSNPSSDTSSRPEASASSSYGASTR